MARKGNKKRSENKLTVREAEDMLLEPSRHDEVLSRFMDRVEVEPGGCWRWLGGFRDRRGRVEARHARPVITVAGKRIFAARAAWSLRNGAPFPAGKVCAHSCDRHDCVNPGHIRPATVAENNREASERVRRFPYGKAAVVKILERKRDAFLSGDKLDVGLLAREARVPATYAARVLRVDSYRVKAVAAEVGL